MGKQTETTFFCTWVDEIIQKINENNKDYTHAYLDTYPLSTNQVQALAGAIEKNDYLSYLNIFDCHLNHSQLKILLRALKNNHSITTVIINKDIGNELYEQFMQAVADNNSTPTPSATGPRR